MNEDMVPLTAAARALCGDKAENLSRLHELGCRIPDGVVLTRVWLERHLARCGLSGALSALESTDDSAWRKEASAIREAVVTSPLEPSLRERLAETCLRWSGSRLAVRSSAVGEDSLDHSFAGQLDTVLGVAGARELESAVRQVWASLWSDRCLAYQRRRGVRLNALAVIVCEQIEAKFSGVLFTRAPAGSACRPDSMLIEYCEGLGDKLVAGSVAPAIAELARGDCALLRYIGIEGSASASDGLPAPIGMLAGTAMKLERQFGVPLDIEWAIDTDNTLWFLQARAITTAQAQVVWSNANIAENFPDVVSPMLYSIAKRGYAAYFLNLGLGFGLSRLRVEAMHDALENIIGTHCGRLYYNLTNIHALLHLMPGGAWLARFFNDFTGAQDFPAAYRPPRAGFLGRVLELLRVPLSVLFAYSRIRSRIARFEAAIDGFCERYSPESLGKLPIDTLRRAVAEFLDIRLRRWNDAALADTAAMVCYGLLRLMVRRAFPANDEASLHNTLLKGLPDLASNEPVARLWALSRRVRGDAALRSLLKHSTAAEFATALARPELAEFSSDFREYLERWGFRSSRELMLTAPTPAEQPEDAVALLKLYVELEGPAPEALLEHETAERAALTSELMRRLSPLRALREMPLASRASRFRLLLAATQGAIRLRERARFRQALLYTRLRRILLAIGDRLVGQEVFAVRDDVFFLEVDELDRLLAGDTTLSGTLANRISERRKSHERFKDIYLPDTLRCRPGERIDEGQGRRVVSDGTDARRLQGTGACGGSYRGIAAVLEDAREASQLSSGSLLVTRQTDPGWATVFFLVRGLVVERGGMLSHGAIIAREYGIPAVVGVPKAMEHIRSGDEVEVDGDRGTVEIFRE